MNWEMRTFIVGALDVNCYILKNPETGHGMAIDPGGEGEKLLQYLHQENIALDAIVNTHAHSDHIGAVDFLREATGAKFYLHELDAPMLADAKKNLSAFMGAPITVKAADGFVKDGQEISFAGIALKVLHTPGHSPGGICLLGDGKLFSGDSLFAGSIGRTDFPGSSGTALIQSLKEKLLALPDGTDVYPGHGPATTIGYERRHNFYLA